MMSRPSFTLVAAALLAASAGCTSQSGTSALPPGSPGSAAVRVVGAQVSRGTSNFTVFPIPTAKAGPNRIVTGPDGALWFTEEAWRVSKLARMTTTGSFSETTLSAGGEPSHVVSGYGYLLVTFANVAYVDRVVPGGSVYTTYVQSSTRGAIPGSGQRIWFTEFEAGMVGILDLSTGACTEYFVPTQGAEPYDVALAASRDELWFTEYGASKIGRMTALGKFMEFPTPSKPQGLVYGPDGALWFTETSANKIGRMTLTGSVTEYPLPTRNAGPLVITAGPDQALWFTEYRASKIGRITTSGGITEIATPDAGAHPTGITTGPDNKLWFVEHSANAIVQITSSR